MPSKLVLTKESKLILKNAILTIPNDYDHFRECFNITFKKIFTCDTFLAFFPEVIEKLITDYLYCTYNCTLFVNKDRDNAIARYLFDIIDTNIYFEIYVYDNVSIGIHGTNYDNEKMNSVVSYSHDDAAFISPSLNNYMQKYYNRDNYFKNITFKPQLTCQNIKKIYDHKSLRLMIVMAKIILNMLEKLVPTIISHVSLT